jgi:ABC transport system ATP-binding/permease protein
MTEITYHLHYQFEEGPWNKQTLRPGENIIGRSTDCTICLPENEISRQHASLKVDADGCWVTDLGSHNGTKLEGVRLDPNTAVEVKPEQVITIGKCRLLIMTAIQQTSLADDPPADMPIDNDHHTTPTNLPRPGASLKDVDRQGGKQSVPFMLKYRKGTDRPWVEVKLHAGDHIIGRDRTCDIILLDKVVSRRHARLEVEEDGLWVMDLGSANGTQLDEAPLSPRLRTRLQPEQHISIIDFELTVTPDVIEKSADFKTPDDIDILLDTLAEKAPIAPAADPDSEIGETMIGESIHVDTPVSSAPLNLAGQDRITIGRAPDNHIVLKHPGVSRYHAVIERLGKRTRITDLHSDNGVYINNQHVKNRYGWLQQGDILKIGPYKIAFTGNELHPSEIEGYTIDARHLQKWVTKSVNLLNDISLYIDENEFIAVVGMSGSGKSTLLNAINGFNKATHGQVLINGVNLYQQYEMFRQEMGNVPQQDIIHMELTPEQTLQYAARLRMPADTTTEERKTAITETLTDLGLDERKDVPVAKLSGGQIKRVSIGMELLTKPHLFFLDEPTSGLDPGTEYEMMKLLRELADQGRTVIIITHATANVMFCDKVLILGEGGNLAFYGPPEYALEYFDTYRTPRERLEKNMEFNDIYRILDDEQRGTAEEWKQRFLTSKYALYSQSQIPDEQISPPEGGKSAQRKRVSTLGQFKILSGRNLRIFMQDRATLFFTLALAPILGLMNFIWGAHLFDPVTGNTQKVMGMWFMTAIIALLVGVMGGVREIVKENAIYRRERAVGLKAMPYIMSKAWIGAGLAVYQGIVLSLFVLVLVRPTLPGPGSYLAFLVTLVLGIGCGYSLGLLISAIAPNQNAALIILLGILIPQFLFSGILQPLNMIPFGRIISPIISTRWTSEAFVKLTGIGDVLAGDPCWQMSLEERRALTKEEKENCPCMGASIFEECASIPGIQSPDYYTGQAQAALIDPRPVQPLEPELIWITPTFRATPTQVGTPTFYPTPTPIPLETLDDINLIEYQMTRQAQFSEYQGSMEEQLQVYQTTAQSQVSSYFEDEKDAMTQYQQDGVAEYENYIDGLDAFGDDLVQWETSRQEAIGAAEAILWQIYQDYGQTFRNSIISRWAALIFIILLQFVVTLIIQRRKESS